MEECKKNYYHNIIMFDSKKIKLIFGETLRELRKQRAITQEQLAEYIGLQPQTIATIETGRAFVSSDVIAKLCNFFTVEPSFFFGQKIKNFSNEDMDHITEIKRMLPSFSSSKLREIRNILIAMQK